MMESPRTRVNVTPEQGCRDFSHLQPVSAEEKGL